MKEIMIYIKGNEVVLTDLVGSIGTYIVRYNSNRTLNKGDYDRVLNTLTDYPLLKGGLDFVIKNKSVFRELALYIGENGICVTEQGGNNNKRIYVACSIWNEKCYDSVLPVYNTIKAKDNTVGNGKCTYMYGAIMIDEVHLIYFNNENRELFKNVKPLSKFIK